MTRRWTATVVALALFAGCATNVRPVTPPPPAGSPSTSSAVPLAPATPALSAAPVGGSPAQRTDNGRLGAVADPAYLRIAEATGGSVTDARVPLPPGTPMFSAAGLPSGPSIAVLARRNQSAGAAEVVPFVVDGCVVRLDVRVRAPRDSKPVIRDPKGSSLAPLRERNGYLEYGVLSPAIGNWLFTLSGAEGKPYELEAQGSGHLAPRVTISERGAEPGPNGPRRLTSRPALEVPYAIDVKLAVTKQGALTSDFSQVELGLLAGSAPARWFPASFEPELGSFRAELAFEPGALLVLRGNLPDGSSFQRILSSVSPSPYRLYVRWAERFWVRGAPQVIPVVVENHGPKAKLELFTIAAHESEVSFDPPKLELDRGESARVLLRVTTQSTERDGSVNFGVGGSPSDPAANRSMLLAKLDGDRDGDGLADRIEFHGSARDDRAVAAFSLPGLPIAYLLPLGMTITGLELIGRDDIDAPAGTQATSGGFELHFAGKAAKPPSDIRLQLDAGLIAFALVPAASGKGPWERRGRCDRSKRELTIPLSRAEQRKLREGTFTLIVAPAEPR